MTGPFSQADYRIRFDWGLAGAHALQAATVRVVVDVLSFTTAVSVAVDAGIDVYPFRWKDERAADFARSVDAVLAQGRSTGGMSLSPASIRRAEGVTRLVLPSPNGSTITAALATGPSPVIAGSLRNARAVGDHTSRLLAADPATSVAVVAAGEHWPDGSLRPAVEDLWGAGAIIGSILDSEAHPASPEAVTAADAYRETAHHIESALLACAGGHELCAIGFAEDVAIAAEVDASDSVPVLIDGCYRSARR